MRLVLLLAVSICVASIIDFGYHAYRRTDFVTPSYHDPLTGGLISPSYQNSEYADAIATDFVLPMQLDAAVALVSIAVALGICIKLGKIPHRKKRLLFRTEALVVALLAVAGLQCILWERPVASIEYILWDWPSELARTLGGSTDERRANWGYETTAPHPDWPTELQSLPKPLDSK